MLSRHSSIVSCRVVSCRVVSCRVVSCRVVSCRVERHTRVPKYLLWVFGRYLPLISRPSRPAPGNPAEVCKGFTSKCTTVIATYLDRDEFRGAVGEEKDGPARWLFRVLAHHTHLHKCACRWVCGWEGRGEGVWWVERDQGPGGRPFQRPL